MGAHMKLRVTELLPGLFQFADTCNVYVACADGEAIAVDFGSGAWLARASKMALPPIRRVYLTHHHADQCAGLRSKRRWPFEIHAPAGSARFIDPRQLRKLRAERGGPMWFPPSHHLLDRGVPNVICDMTGFGTAWWRRERIRFLHTPGHGPHAVSVVLDHAGRQIAFCGDAAHHGATIHQPFNLEWDHWTNSGALAALEGVKRLGNIAMDMLLPAHGPIITRRPRAMLRQLARKLQRFADAKGSICPGEKDRYVTPLRAMACGAMEIVPGLYWFNNGGYLLRSQTGEAIITDPGGDLRTLDALLDELGDVRITAQLVTHYHADHTDGVETIRRPYGAKLWLHPRVAAVLARGGACDVPYLSRKAITPDHLWPDEGQWRWNEFDFTIAPFAGQTWWHCCFMTRINGRRVLFGGDNFQPASRWNGTGGFCALNGSRFREGFIRSAELVLRWKPHIIVNGHATWMHCRASYFRKVIAWARRAESAVKAICPSGNLELDYHLHHP